MFSLSLALIFLGVLGTAVILKYQVPVGLIAGIGAVLTVLGFFVIRKLYKGPRSYADQLQGLVATYQGRTSKDLGQEQARRICASPAALQGWVAKERAMLRAELARRVA